MTLFEEKYEESRKNIFIIENNTELLVSMQRAMYNEFNVFYASSSPGALDKITKIPMPDVIILNTLMEPVNGHPLHSEFSESRKFRHIPVIFISCQGNRKEKHECLKQGAVDYITIPFDNHELILKIKALLKMQHIQLQKIEEKIKSLIRSKEDDEFLRFEKKCKKYHISPREKEILNQIISGIETKKIAGILFLSIHTVKKHIRSIYKKCNVQNRVELINCIKD